MIQSVCACGEAFSCSEAEVGQPGACEACGSARRLVAGEEIPDGQGSADFDARLEIVGGPDRLGEQVFLGGVADVPFGKSPAHPLALVHASVSRNHGRLCRVDFGPGKWRLADDGSTNGTLVNGEKTTDHELADGDVIKVGPYHLRYKVADLYVPKPVPAVASGGTGQTCPSCGASYGKKAKLCVACGIDLKTGRAILTRHGVDENEIHIRTQNAVTVLSWIFPTGIYPVASDAFGASKPYYTWGMAGVTILASLIFYIGSWTSFGLPPGSNFMLWPPASLVAAADMAATGGVADETAGVDEAADEEVYEDEEEAWFAEVDVDGDGTLSPAEIQTMGEQQGLSAEEIAQMQALMALVADEVAAFESYEFSWYQLLTHALLHDGLLHLAGNMLFLFVFGTRVNALIGNLATAIIYPVLAIGAAAIHLYFDGGDGIPMLGASGAIMGLAGMYFVLCPVHQVWMTAWIRWGLLAGFKLSHWTWAMRGFWVVLFYISFDVVLTLLQAEDGVAHWAHLGGFGVGMLIALILLCGRLVNARGGDLLSAMLGRHAWALVGKPNRDALPA